MRKFGLLILLILVICNLSFVICTKTNAQVTYPGIYFINGKVIDTDSVGTDGLWIVFFKEYVGKDIISGFADDYVGTQGLSGRPNEYILPAIEDHRLAIKPGKYYVASVQRVDGYGCDPVEVTVTGHGYDIAPDLVLAYGAGMTPPSERPELGKEAEPSIKVWFGNRLYQPDIYGLKEDGKKPFVVSETGELKIKVEIADPYLLDETASYRLSLKDPEGVIKEFDLQSVPGFKTSVAAGAPEGVRSLDVETPFPEALKTKKDEELVYTFTFNARSHGHVGAAASASTQAVVYVMGGPVQLIGIPITYPSPIRLKTDKKVTFQYTLSRDADINLSAVDISARTVKKVLLRAGEEGGSAGVNKVEWDLITDQGTRLDSGIYIFTLVHEGKLLGKGKLTALP